MKRILQPIRSALLKIDVLGVPISFRHHGENKCKSVSTGCMSVVIFLILIAFFVKNLSDILNLKSIKSFQ